MGQLLWKTPEEARRLRSSVPIAGASRSTPACTTRAASVTPGVTMGRMGTRRFSISAREEIHDRIRAHADAAGVDISTYMIAAAIQQMIRDDQAAASFARSMPSRRGHGRIRQGRLTVPVRDLIADFRMRRASRRLLRPGDAHSPAHRDPRARAAHDAPKSPRSPVITGPVVAQVWRDAPAIVHALAGITGDCTILQAKDDIGPIRGLERGVIGCLPCHRVYRRADFQRAGHMLGKAHLPANKKPGAVDALVMVAAAWHSPSLVLTSDPEDLLAYPAVLDTHQVEIISVA